MSIITDIRSTIFLKQLNTGNFEIVRHGIVDMISEQYEECFFFQLSSVCDVSLLATVALDLKICLKSSHVILCCVSFFPYADDESHQKSDSDSDSATPQKARRSSSSDLMVFLKSKAEKEMDLKEQEIKLKSEQLVFEKDKFELEKKEREKKMYAESEERKLILEFMRKQLMK